MKYLKYIEVLIAVFLCLEIIFLIFNLIDNDSLSPLIYYYENRGIIAIIVMAIIFRIVFISTVFLSLKTNYTNNLILKYVYFLSGILIAVFQWIEYYYGSTFYYGDVRDKQGLGFPLLSSVIISLLICKIDYSADKKTNIMIKILVTLIINAGLIGLYILVYKPWNLYQS